MTTAMGLKVRPRREKRPPVGPVRCQSIDLYWLPVGAGGQFVRFNGRLFERIQAIRDRRPMEALYHAALDVQGLDGRYVVEVTPVPKTGADRGVVSEGPVGSRSLGRFRHFRYEVRRWKDGVILDVDEAVSSPLRLSDDADAVGRLLELVPAVPTCVWGRDELQLGEMWTSNSVVSWLLARSGLSVESARLPLGGRAPGWDAGLAAAAHELREAQLERVLAAVGSCASRQVMPGEREAERYVP